MNIYVKKKHSLPVAILRASVILLIMVLGLHFFEHPLKNIFYAVSAPLTSFLQKQANHTSLFLNGIFRGNQLQKENVFLKSENEKLILENASLREQIRGEANIVAMSQYSNGQFKTISTTTIGIDMNRGFLTLDKGLDSGIKEGMPVISSSGVLYGKITTVYKSNSVVILVSNPENVMNVKIDDPHNPTEKPVYGTVRGAGIDSLFLDLVPLDASLEQGDILVTSGLEGVFPKNLLVGTLVEIYKNDLKSFQTAKVKPLFDFRSIEHLFVITH